MGMLRLSAKRHRFIVLMGRRPMKDVLGNHLKDLLFHLVHWLSITPLTAKDQSRIHQLGKKVLPGLFLGYALYAGGIWKGDVLIADLEELETMDASEIYSKRLNSKEVIFPKQGEFYFSNRRRTNRNTWRRSGTENIHLETAASNSRRKVTWTSLENQKGLLPQPHDSFPDAGEAIHDFWSMSGSFNIPPSR